MVDVLHAGEFSEVSVDSFQWCAQSSDPVKGSAGIGFRK
jgi:hypothetical protein